MANLLEKAGIGFYNLGHELFTGEATPGSKRDRREKADRAIEDRKNKLTIRGLDRELYGKTDPPPKALTAREQADLEYTNSLRNTNITDRQNDSTLRYIGAENLLDARGQMTDQSIKGLDAATRNTMLRQQQLYGHQRNIVGDLGGIELDLQDGNQRFANSVMGFAGTENDKRRAYATRQLVTRLLGYGGLTLLSKLIG